jgi:predicted short-subunit dehydrogenase-like oxidoreductase (DUF2520 family)
LNTAINNIVLVGAGNVATHLGIALKEQGYRIIQVFSRTIKSAQELAGKLDSVCITKLDALDYSADFYLFCVKDDVLPDLLKQTVFTNQVLVHTAGSLPLNIFKDFGSHYGVIYPVQTFIKERNLDLTNVPFCIEASTPYAEKILMDLASGLSQKVEIIDSEKRKIIHLAAIFACNFTNHMYFLADQLMRGNNLDFDLLKPLIRETAAKIMELDPGTAQTGPAKRGDIQILEEHLQLLKDLPGMQKIYTFVSDSITESFKNRHMVSGSSAPGSSEKQILK